jgi:hypothetical protein
MPKSIAEQADALRIEHKLPGSEHSEATIAHALAGADGAPIIDAEKLRAGDTTHQAAVRTLLGL